MDRVHTFTPETGMATPLALGDHCNHSTHHTDHPRAHWLALKTAMHWAVDAPTTDTTLPAAWSHSLATRQPTYKNTGHHRLNAGCPGPQTRNKPSNLAPPACKNTRTNFEVCTDSVRDKDRHTASSTTATRRSQPPSRRQNKPCPSRGLLLKGRASRPAAPNEPSRNQKRPQCRCRPNHSRAQSPRRAHSSRWRNGTPCTPNGQTASGTRGVRGHAQRTTKAICMVPGQDTERTTHARPTWQPAAEDQMARARKVGRESGNLDPRTLGRQAVPGVPGTAPHTRQPSTTGHRLFLNCTATLMSG